MTMRLGSTLSALLLVTACASAPEKPPPKASSPPAHEATPPAAPGDDGEDREAPPPTPAASAAPKTAADIPEAFGTRCPVPPFTLERPEEVTLGKHRFVVEGSTMRRLGGKWQGRLTLGVLGALKDASDATKKNVDKAARVFKKERVDLVVVNGDLGEDTELLDVMNMLGERFDVPVLLHAGNMEWITAFTEAYVEAKKRHPLLINGNWTRHLDLGGVHLVTLPGWSNHKFTSSGACRYGKDEVQELRALAAPLTARGDVVILVAHGPPQGEGKRALDMTHDAGNVGDVPLRAVIEELPIRFGLFSHILEAGGRAARSFDERGVVRLPVRRPEPRLYVNAGSASAFPWGMLSGRTSEGMAMVFRLDKGKATAKRFLLRPLGPRPRKKRR